MALSYARNMHQTATYWAPLGNDGFGARQMASPVLIRCRWQESAQLFRDSTGREVASSVVVYPAESVEMRGYLCLGDQSYIEDPRDLEGAYEIRQVQKSPNLRNTEELHKAYL